MKRIITTIMIITLILMNPMSVLATESISEKAAQTFVNPCFDNTLESLPMYGTSRNSYLHKTTQGYQEVLIDDKVYIFNYKKGKLSSKKTIKFELPIWGGFYSGKKYNYMVFGQKATSEDSEMYRVVKYDKNFKRIKSLSVYYLECYTSVPFEAGNVSIAESGNHLIVYTSRLRPNGHQSNIALRIDTSNMTIEDEDGMVPYPDIHVSHSFRQFVTFDDDQPVYVDLGDAYPRAVYLQQPPNTYANMLDISGEVGDNQTDTDVSGVAVTDTGYLVVGTQVVNACNNIYLSYVKKGATSAKVVWLTNNSIYNYSNLCNTKIIEVTDGCYAVMWNCFDKIGNASVNYVMVNAAGELISSTKTLNGAELTQCEPIVYNGKVIWTKYVDGERTVYSLNDFACTGTYKWENTYIPAKNAWNGKTDTSWYKSAKSVYRLRTPQQLAGFAKLVNDGNTFKGKKVILEKDMFFNKDEKSVNIWTPIASMSSDVAFEGTFDGQGHTLYNMYLTKGNNGGLFGLIGENGIVKAVRVTQSTMYGAAIAYQNKGWILFCENNGLLANAGDTEYTAGICCINENLVYGCANTGMVKGDNASGIVGRNSKDVATIDSCWNQGYVGGNGFAVAGIVSSNHGWVYDCYNAGTISGTDGINYAKTVAGIVGNHHGDREGMIYNCYHSGYLDIDDVRNWYRSNTICGEGRELCVNVYSIPARYNTATELTLQELKNPDTISKLQGDKVIQKWCVDKNKQNNGQIIPIAQQDKKKGVYKILPDVWEPKKKIKLNFSPKKYTLEAFSYAYYGIKNAKATYSSDSKKISITKNGKITFLDTGSAIVKVSFGGSENTKKTSYNVKVIINPIKAKKGQVFTVDSYKYKVTGSSTVAFYGIKSTKTTKVTIPKTVKYGGKTFKVTSIAEKALKGCKKLSKVTIGSAVTTIKSNAFYGCKNLKTITIKSTKLKTVGKNAFKNINAKATIKVPKKKLSAYKKLLKGKGQGSKVKIVKY